MAVNIVYTMLKKCEGGFAALDDASRVVVSPYFFRFAARNSTVRFHASAASAAR